MLDLTVQNQTMSSKEIAQLTDKDHKNVIRDIRKMLEDLQIDGSNLSHQQYQQLTDRRGYISEFLLDKELTFTLTSRYSFKLANAVTKRWLELEAQVAKPKELSRKDLALMVIESEERAEREEALRIKAEAKIEEDAPKVEFADQVTMGGDTMLVRQAAKLLGTGQNTLYAFLRSINWVQKNNEPYQAKITAGYLDVKITKYEHPYEGTKRKLTTVVTGKGLVKLKALWG